MVLRRQSFSHSSVQKLVSKDAGLILGLLWGLAEAVFWPIIPDYYVFVVTPASPARWWRVALFTSAGSVIGGSMGFWWAYARADSFPLEIAPLITIGMIDQANVWLAELGAFGVIQQPFSGVPYKVFVYLAGAERQSFAIFLWTSVVARSSRIFAVALVAAGLGRLASERWRSRLYDAFLVLVTAAFAYALWRVVQAYS